MGVSHESRRMLIESRLTHLSYNDVSFEITDRMAFLSEVADKHLIALQEPLDDAPVHDVQKQLRGLRFDSVKLPEQLF